MTLRAVASIAASLMVLASACAPPPRAEPPAPPPRAPPPRAALPDTGWGTVVSRQHFLRFPLPDAEAWRVEDGPTWLTAEHRPSDSLVLARTWRADGPVNPRDCAADAREAEPRIPDVTPESLVDLREVDRPVGYDTLLLVAVRPADSPGAVDGFVLAFGAKARRCLTLVYRTRASGAGAEQQLGERLGLIAHGTVERLESYRIEDRQGRVAPP